MRNSLISNIINYELFMTKKASHENRRDIFRLRKNPSLIKFHLFEVFWTPKKVIIKLTAITKIKESKPKDQLAGNHL